MHDTVTIIGNVATDPTQGRTTSGIPVTNFRLASTHRRFDDATQTWVDVTDNLTYTLLHEKSRSAA